jgi:dTDP-4-dehydrorhamnose 3,5-epimerase
VIFTETTLKGAWTIELEPLDDERGFFSRTWCVREAQEYGLNTRVVQCNVSFNKRRGTLRGMHYQAEPYREAKLIRCTRGEIYDVIIDLRVESPTFKQHVAVILDATSRRQLYVPEGFAHGFQTRLDDTEVVYQMSEFYSAAHARGVRWNDPAFAIQWPDADRTISLRDQTYSDFAATDP